MERDQRDLANAVKDLQTAGAESGRRAIIWLGAVVMTIVAARMGSGARRNSMLLRSTTPATSLENLSRQSKTSMDVPLNAFGAAAEPSSMGRAITASLFTLGVGLLLGAGIALLLAPKTGAEMRRDFARRSNSGEA